jgi:outer membrane receptor protein involved in Fe transport
MIFPNQSIRHYAFALACLPCVAPVIAADDTLEEIVVTADYRERTLAELPLSVSVIDAATINGSAIQHFEELIAIVPNMNWSGDGHRARYLQIRGVGELAQYQGAPNPSVGFIIDDIDFSGIGTIATLYDIEQIEVLRGPQGTRYGANALAGLVYIQSAAPDDQFTGQVRLGAGQDDALSAGVAMGGPLGEHAAYRLSAHQYTSNGFRKNPYLDRDDTNGRDELSIRGKLRWQAGDDWVFNLAAMLSDVDDGYDAFAIDNSLTVLSDNPGKDAQRSVGSSFKAIWSGARSFDLTSITSFANSDIDFSFDADWGNDDAWAPVTYDFVSLNDRKRQALSQEFRLTSTDDGRIFSDSTDWLVGLYVNRLNEDLTTINLGDYFDPGFNFADTLDDRLASEFEALTSAIFGQLEVAVSDAGTFSVGLRLERRSTDYNDSNGLSLGPSDNMIGGEVSYSHAVSNAATIFGSISKGYKAGGFNLGFVPQGRREFDQESLWNYELGIKSVLADGDLMINASVFYSTRNDQQVETSLQLNPNDPASFVFFTDNAAKGETFGFEADVRWLPTDSLELYASVGLLRAQFEEFTTPLIDLTGRDQAHAPRYTLATGGVYRHSSGLFARLDLSAKDAFYFDVSHDQKSDAYTLANARLGFEADRWTAQVYARNLFDTEYAVRGFFFGNEPPNFPPTLYIRQGDPRQIGVTVDMRF